MNSPAMSSARGTLSATPASPRSTTSSRGSSTWSSCTSDTTARPAPRSMVCSSAPRSRRSRCSRRAARFRQGSFGQLQRLDLPLFDGRRDSRHGCARQQPQRTLPRLRGARQGLAQGAHFDLFRKRQQRKQGGEDGRVAVDPKPVPGVEWARGSFRMPDGSVRRIEWGSPCP